jgi:hypothetical protein
MKVSKDPVTSLTKNRWGAPFLASVARSGAFDFHRHSAEGSTAAAAYSNSAVMKKSSRLVSYCTRNTLALQQTWQSST